MNGWVHLGIQITMAVLQVISTALLSDPRERTSSLIGTQIVQAVSLNKYRKRKRPKYYSDLK